MKLKYKVFIGVGVSAIVLIVIAVLYYVSLWLIVIWGFSNAPSPPRPEVTYGEFPFKLIYELNGETKMIEDVVICEFDGIKNWGSAGKYRKWKIHIKSTGKDMITLYNVRSNNDFTEWGNQILELCFAPGNAEYYMGDLGSRSREGSMGKWIDYLYLTPNGEEGYSAFELDEAWEKYRIRIISWEPSPPIENTFK